MKLPKQSPGIIRSDSSTPIHTVKNETGVESQQFLGCQTGPCINGKRYRVCVTRKTVCREIPGSEELGIPSEVICVPGDYDVRVQELDCSVGSIPLPNFPTRVRF